MLSTHLKIKKTWLGLAAVVPVLCLAGYATYSFANKTEVLKAKLAHELPSTKVSSVSCGWTVGGLCEVIAGKNIFYVSPDAEYVLIGEIIDMKKRVNMTDQRLKEVAAVDAATGTISGTAQAVQLADTGKAAQSPGGNAGTPPLGANVKITLPAVNSIVHNKGAPIKVAVFSDYGCHFCKNMFSELISHPEIEVTEYPIAILGPQSTQKAKLVLCADDKVAAGSAAYNGGEIKTRSDCSKTDGIVDQNTKFAMANGINSTPTIIRADGQSQLGFVSIDEIKSFAAGS